MAFESVCEFIESTRSERMWGRRHHRARAVMTPDYCYSVTPLSLKSFQTFGGVIGMSMCLTPRCQSASTTALTIAAGAPTVADSPTPLAPSGGCGEGGQGFSVSQFRVSTALGSR